MKLIGKSLSTLSRIINKMCFMSLHFSVTFRTFRCGISTLTMLSILNSLRIRVPFFFDYHQFWHNMEGRDQVLTILCEFLFRFAGIWWENKFWNLYYRFFITWYLSGMLGKIMLISISGDASHAIVISGFCLPSFMTKRCLPTSVAIQAYSSCLHWQSLAHVPGIVHGKS